MPVPARVRILNQPGRNALRDLVAQSALEPDFCHPTLVPAVEAPALVLVQHDRHAIHRNHENWQE
jgi:hypothetical protein